MLANYDEIFLSPEQVEEELSLRVLGFGPRVPEGLQLIRNVPTFHPAMESYRSLRTNIYFATLDRPAHTLLVTSSVPGEGKSTVAANLATALRMESKRVILVDTDLRRPSLYKLLETSATPGMTDVLMGTCTLADALRTTDRSGMQFLPSGTLVPNPTELVASPAFAALLEELKSLCDVVVLDSPPVLAVADAPLVAHRADATLVVMGAGETRKRNVRKSLDVLSFARANVIGLVVNRMEAGLTYYYGKYYVPTETPEENGEAEP